LDAAGSIERRPRSETSALDRVRRQQDGAGAHGTLYLTLELMEILRRHRGHGLVRLVECADAPLVTLIARDPKLRRLCSLVGDHHLAVPLGHEEKFRRTVRTLGHIVTAATG
jgi:hypothetical protein